MNQTEEAVERTALGLAEGSAKIEEVRREVAGQKAQLSDYCPKVKNDLTNLERGPRN
jgi:hypothetical protein